MLSKLVEMWFSGKTEPEYVQWIYTLTYLNENIFDAFLFFCRYLKGTLDQYVESDYTLIYFHHGLTSENKPSLSWLRDAYREFDRKYV